MTRRRSARDGTARPLRRLRGCIVILSAALLLASPVFADAQPLVDWMGTWYVLVHYRDASAPDPEALAWEDRIWIFELRGSRLQWTEYSIVLFDDEGRRFELLPGGRRSRVEGGWEPRPQELEEIRRGLEVNPLGMRAKSLRGNAQQGYRSLGAMNTDSASTIGYSETWEIRDPEMLPQFLRRDVMGGGRTEDLEDTIAFRSERILEQGRQIEGNFERDAHIRGTFRMFRAGEVARARSGKRQGSFEPDGK